MLVKIMKMVIKSYCMVLRVCRYQGSDNEIKEVIRSMMMLDTNG